MYNNPKMVFNVLFYVNLGFFISAVFFIFGIGVEYNEGRLTIFGENSNRIGLFSVFSLIYIFSTIIENKQNYNKWRYWLLVLIVPLLNMAAQTASRVTFFALVLSVGLFFILKSDKNIAIKLFYTFLGAISIYAIFSYLMTFDLLRDRLFSFIDEGNLSGRDILWTYTIPFILEKPVIGVGVNGYTHIISGLRGSFFSPHNVFIEIIAYSGFLGLLTFFLFFYRIFRAAIDSLKNHKFVLLFINVVLIFFIFFSGQGLAVKFFWILYACIITININLSKQIDFLSQNKDKLS